MKKQMVIIVAGVVALSLMTNSAMAEAQKKLQGPVQVFILAGQSNMEGHGGIRTLDELGKEPTTHGDLLKRVKKDDGSFVVRDDVFVYYNREEDPIKKPLTVGMGKWPNEIGPELMFGIEMADYYKKDPSCLPNHCKPVLLIKTCWGGHNLFGLFRSPSAGKLTYYTGDWPKPEDVGASYRKMVKEVHECLDKLDVNFPELQGLKYEIRGFVWFQGWNDMCTYDEKVYQEYCPNFVHLVQDLRTEFKVPNMPAVVGELGVGGEKADKDITAFRAAQEKIATCTELKGTVGYVRTAPFWYPALDELPKKLELEEQRVRNKVKAQILKDTKGKPESSDPKKLEQLIKEAGDKALKADAEYQKVHKEHDKVIAHWGCHYQGSARVYCMVGYALARAMEPLLAKTVTPRPW